MGIRTDLAVEAHELRMKSAGRTEGVAVRTSTRGRVRRTTVDIVTDEGAEALCRAKGRYITIEAPELRRSLDDHGTVCRMIAEEIGRLCGGGTVLVVGLGNRAITPDALGPAAADGVIVTKHIAGLDSDGFGSVCAVSPGVMGTTGMETADIVRGIVSKLSPSAVIAVDALAGADIRRVCSTVQISDTGIQPGSGIGGDRMGLTEESLGVKVIAVGVPTVIAAELLGGDKLPKEYGGLMVTTRDIDLVIKRMSKTVAGGINLALHKGLTLEEIESIVD